MNHRNYMSYLWGGAALVLTALFLYAVRSIAIPFLLALLLAYCLDPVVDWLEERKIGRSLGIGLAFFLVGLLVAGAIVLIVPGVKRDLAQLQQSLPSYAANLYQMIPPSVLDLAGVKGGGDLQDLMSRAFDGAKSLSFDVVNQVAVFLSQAFTSTLSFLLAVFGYLILPVYLFYLLRDFDRFKGGLVELIPPRHQRTLLSLGKEIDSVLSGFLRGQLTVCLILGLLYSIGLSVIGIDLALVVGFTSGLAFIIPYLGTALGVVVAGSMAAAKFHDWIHPLQVAALYATVQILEGTVISPRVVGERVGLHPLGTILAVLVGGELFGFLGLLLAVPFAASLTVVLRFVLGRYRTSGLYLPQGGGRA